MQLNHGLIFTDTLAFYCNYTTGKVYQLFTEHLEITLNSIWKIERQKSKSDSKEYHI